MCLYNNSHLEQPCNTVPAPCKAAFRHFQILELTIYTITVLMHRSSAYIPYHTDFSVGLSMAFTNKQPLHKKLWPWFITTYSNRLFTKLNRILSNLVPWKNSFSCCTKQFSSKSEIMDVKSLSDGQIKRMQQHKLQDYNILIEYTIIFQKYSQIYFVFKLSEQSVDWCPLCSAVLIPFARKYPFRRQYILIRLQECGRVWNHNYVACCLLFL